MENNQFMNNFKLWIARDENGGLYLYNDKPILWNFEGQQKFVPNRYKGTPFEPESIAHFIMKIDSKLFSELTFENSPQQVELTLVKDNGK